MARIGVIGDTQAPAQHPGYMQFCLDTFDEWGGVDEYVHMGDLVDMHYQSFHDKHPEMPGPLGEYQQALKIVADWYAVIPKMHVLRGNHDERALRGGAQAGIPEVFFKGMAKVWEVPNWKFVESYVRDGVLYIHGHGCGGGEHPAYNYLKKTNDYSVALGHHHIRAGIKWLVGLLTRRFGMDVGCGVDRLSPAMLYDRRNPLKPVLACAVVIDGHPYQELMPCGPNERYHRSKFTRRSRK